MQFQSVPLNESIEAARNKRRSVKWVKLQSTMRKSNIVNDFNASTIMYLRIESFAPSPTILNDLDPNICIFNFNRSGYLFPVVVIPKNFTIFSKLILRYQRNSQKKRDDLKKILTRVTSVYIVEITNPSKLRYQIDLDNNR